MGRKRLLHAGPTREAGFPDAGILSIYSVSLSGSIDLKASA